LNGDPVATKENEYAIIENAYEAGYAKANPPKVRTGKKIAVIGSGPAGLAAADQLNRRGHLVTVFERSDRVGGLLMYGIPNMKLEKEIIARRIRIMEEEGVEFVTGVDVGRDLKADKILHEFDRVILACGASNPRDIGAPGRDAQGIYFAVDFLIANTQQLLDSSDTKDSIPCAKNDANVIPFVNTKDCHVIIIGGGDTGNDCVGTAIRHGAKSVTQIEMMPKAPDTRAPENPWPEWPRICKTDYGQEEAIAVFGSDPRVYESTVKEFIKDESGKLTAVRIVKLSWEKDANTGRMNMKEVEGSEEVLPADVVLIAAGFLGAQSYVADAFGVALNERSNVKTLPGDYQTSVDKVFAAGDMHRGQSLVVWAIREGREVACAVDTSLMGYSNLVVM
jgi:glutamate synthase (NADPH/NADH) small chain